MSETRNEAREIDLTSDSARHIGRKLEGLTEAVNRLADAYLYCNAPDEEGEESRPGQSLSDVG